MASKREEYKLAMVENLIVDVLREGKEEEYIDKVRDCLYELQDCYSFKEDDLYHPRISKKSELRESYESIRKASLREHVNYYVMLGDEPKYSTEEQNAADLLGTVMFNRIINGTSKREFYLMAKYVVMTDELLREGCNDSFLSQNEMYQLSKKEDNINAILEELNTSGRKFIGKRLTEHDFDNADAEKAEERYEKMGGEVKYYAGTLYSPPEYVYNEGKLDSAYMYQAIAEQEKNILYNRNLIEMEMKRMGADIEKSTEYVKAINVLNDKVFLDEGTIDRERAEKICVSEKNDNFPMKERIPYLEILMYVDNVYDNFKNVKLFNDGTKLFSSDEEKINTVLDSIVKPSRNEMKLYIKDNVFHADWKYYYDKERHVEIPYDGTLEGFIKSCENYEKRDDCCYWQWEKGNFLNNILSYARVVSDSKKYVEGSVINMHKVASMYLDNHGEKFVPKLFDTMKELASCNIDDALAGKSEIWNNKTQAMLHSNLYNLKDSLEQFGKKRNDNLYYRLTAAKRVLKAYKVMSDVLAKEIKIEQGVGKELKK